ncbi:MAG: hypothetical protein K9K82_08065 [Desulfobacteraceae bacterium]|nr:hypothetical protein [Desulfobacteraceae bacterium]
MFSSRMLSEWLDAIFPDWYGLAAAMLLGAFGVMALGLLILGVAPHVMFMWMPVIALFCGASSGYKFREKRDLAERVSGTDLKSVPERAGYSLKSASYLKKILLPVSGLGPGAAATALQGLVDRRIFHTEITLQLAALILACAVLGAFAGGLLRSRYEKT